MPYGKPTDPDGRPHRSDPGARARCTRSGEQQIAVLAHYTDGSTEDVTGMAQFEPNDPEMAEVIADAAW